MRAIGRELGRDASTVSRELARNRSEGDYYLPDRAQQMMQTRRQQSKTAFSHVSEICIFEIKQRLKPYHSPEQIAGRLKREGGEQISHETIYQMIYADHAGLKDDPKYLRQGRGKRRQRGGCHSKRGQIVGGTSKNTNPIENDNEISMVLGSRESQ